MENPVTQAEWQEWSSWSSCSGNPPVKKRTRFCGIPFKRSVQPNRNCKDQSGLRNGNRETNRESQVCSDEDLNGGSNGKDLIRTGFNRPNGIAQELSAPECYYPPGTKMQDDVFDDSQPLRIVGGKQFQEFEILLTLQKMPKNVILTFLTDFLRFLRSQTVFYSAFRIILSSFLFR